MREWQSQPQSRDRDTGCLGSTGLLSSPPTPTTACSPPRRSHPPHRGHVSWRGSRLENPSEHSKCPIQHACAMLCPTARAIASRAERVARSGSSLPGSVTVGRNAAGAAVKLGLSGATPERGPQLPRGTCATPFPPREQLPRALWGGLELWDVRFPRGFACALLEGARVGSCCSLAATGETYRPQAACRATGKFLFVWALPPECR